VAFLTNLSLQSSYLWGTLQWIQHSLFGDGILSGWLGSGGNSLPSAERGTEIRDGAVSDQDYPYMDDILLPGQDGATRELQQGPEVEGGTERSSVGGGVCWSDKSDNI
jgi:hypothetical protein